MSSSHAAAAAFGASAAVSAVFVWRLLVGPAKPDAKAPDATTETGLGETGASYITTTQSTSPPRQEGGPDQPPMLDGEPAASALTAQRAAVAERLFRAHSKHTRRGTLRLCLHALREHALRRVDERRFQGQLQLHRGALEEAQTERDEEVEARWHGMLERLVLVHEEVRAAQLEAQAGAHDAALALLDGELRALEAALVAAEARHASELRAQRRAMLAATARLLACGRLVLGAPAQR